MPRYDDYRGDRGYDRHGNTRLYVGHLSTRTRTHDLDRLFSRYGRVRDVDMKNEFAFIDFSDPRDADDARYSLDGRDVDGSRITVEFAKGTPRGPGGTREYMGRGPPPGSGRCFNCGLDGHWARDCKAGDWKNKCYRCGERGHVERNCNNSPKKLSRDRSYSPSPVRSDRRRSRIHSRGRSYSRSKSPVKRERNIEHREKRSRSPTRDKKSSSPLKIRKHSPMSDEGVGSPKEIPDVPKREASYSESPEERSKSPEERSKSPEERSKSPEERSKSPEERSKSPEERSKSPGSPEKDNSPEPMKSQSPSEANGRSPSPIPKEDERSHIYEDEDKCPSARGNE